MSFVRATVRLINLIFLLLVLHVAASAQELPGRVAGFSSTPAANVVTPDTSSSLQSSTDNLDGLGTKGPYTLTWKPIDRMSERVFVDGSLMRRGVDYDIEYNTSMIAFTTPVSRTSKIRVEYSYPNGASKNNASVNVPLSFNLVNNDSSQLNVLGMYKQGDPNAKGSNDTLAYGLAGTMKSGGNALSSMFILNPSAPGKDNGSFGDSSALKLGGSAKAGGFQFTSNYSRIGKDFATAKDYQLQQGSQAFDYNAIFNAGSAIRLSSSLKQNEFLSGTNLGDKASTSAYGIDLNPMGATKLSLTRVEQDTDKLNTASVKTTTDQILLSSKPSDKFAFGSNVTQKDSSVNGKETDMGVDVNASPTKALNLKAGLSRIDSEQSGRSQSENLRVAANPVSKLNIELNLLNKDNEVSGSEFSQSLKLVSDQMNKVHFEAGMTGKNADNHNDESSRTLDLATTAIKNTTLSLDWRDSDSEVSGFETYTGIRLESSPWKRLKISGAFGQRDTSSVREYNREGKLDITPITNTQIVGSMKELESNGQIMSRVTEVNAKTKPISLIELEAGYKSREILDQEKLESLNLAATLNTGRVAKITGAYTRNPEDNCGAVQRLDSRSIGLQSDFGNILLRGKYSLQQEYLLGNYSSSTDVGLDLKFSKYTSLTTSYHLDENMNSSLMQTSIYSIGFVHKVGSDVDFYLGGKLTTYEKDRMIMNDMTDYQAEAKLGLKL